jgi:FkbM family methyltransferase
LIIADGPTPTELATLDRFFGRMCSRPLSHIKSWFPDRVRTIIDGGASVGNYSAGYAAEAPDATVHAFEPLEMAFLQLQGMAEKVPSIKPWQLALSDFSGPTALHVGETWTGGQIDPDGEINITAITGRDFCAEHGIDRVNFLKLDVEGHELKALDGFDLEKVDFVQVEAGVNRHQTQMRSYQELYDYLVERKFWVFGFYDQIFEFKQGAFVGTVDFPYQQAHSEYVAGAPIIRRMDVVFINNDLVKLR